MKSIDLYNAVCAVDDDILERSEVASYERKKKIGWLKWRTLAACFGLILTAAMMTLPGILRAPAGGPGSTVPGETHTGGVDPIIDSIAVYPATEDIQDVADATMESIGEADAYGFPGLGEYLPAELPVGYHFNKADLYETTMKNGIQYHLLRVTYAAGSGDVPTASMSDDGGVLAPTPDSFSPSFAFFVMDYEPKTSKTIYHFEDLPEFLETMEDIATFLFSYGDMYIGFSPSKLSTEEILTVVNSIPCIPDQNNESAASVAPSIPMGQGYFNATVIKISSNCILVKCTDIFAGKIPAGSEVQVSTNTLSDEKVPEVKIGDNIRVYNGPRDSDHGRKKDREYGRISKSKERGNRPWHEQHTARSSRQNWCWRY